MMGLSIGVHILNLLTIPALVFIYYFRKTEKVTFKGTVYATLIAGAILLLLERTKQVVEPSGAAPLAAVLNHKVDIRGKKVCCVLSGGNIDVSFIHKVVGKGLVTRGRHLKFSTIMPDAPGSLERFAHLVAEQNANVILFNHDRVQADLDVVGTLAATG